MTIQDYLSRLCQHVGLTDDQFSIEFNEEDSVVEATIQLPESESGLFIGYHGETLQSLQRMVRITFYEELQDKTFKLNINNYREQRQDQLEEKVVGIAQRVIETGEPYTFPYLTAHDRFIIHSTLSGSEEFADLTSESEGEGKERYLTIRLKSNE
jgi:predicted RNA-binding protein Jag